MITEKEMDAILKEMENNEPIAQCAIVSFIIKQPENHHLAKIKSMDEFITKHKALILSDDFKDRVNAEIEKNEISIRSKST